VKLRSICKSKIHRATVTEANVDYVGSIGIDESLMKRTGIVNGEQVMVWNVTTGARVSTYVIPMPEGSGQIAINGAAARHFTPGDLTIIVAFYLTDEAVVPQMILVDEKNRFVKNL
jgi:aspartate 1-decarboxylase